MNMLFTYTGGGLESLPIDRLAITEAIIDADIPEGDDFNELCGLFSGCSNLEKVTFSSPTSITRIGCNCFRNCTSLKEIVDLEKACNLEDIMAFAFSGCKSLEELILPSVAHIKVDDGAFECCEVLARINLPPRGCVDFGYHIFGAATLIRSFAGIDQPAYSDSTVTKFLQSDEYRKSCPLFPHEALPDLLRFVLHTDLRPSKVMHPKPPVKNQDSEFTAIKRIGHMIRVGGHFDCVGVILSFLSAKHRPIRIMPSNIREYPVGLASLKL